MPSHQNENLCLRCSNKEERMKHSDNALCSEKISTDGYKLRCVGDWAIEKIKMLENYFTVFSNGMKNKWDNINYIEICSGPGICFDRKNNKEIEGTAITILKSKGYNSISKCIFIDNQKEVVEVLYQRIINLKKEKATVIEGDYKESRQIAELIYKNTNQHKALNLVFIDPTDCSVPFSTIQEIKNKLKRVDFILNVATKTDFNRNIKNIILEPEKYGNLKNKYEDFINNPNFFNANVLHLVSNDKLIDVRKLFRENFLNELKKIGLKYHDFRSVRYYYDILFVSANSRGLDLWKKANTIDSRNQRSIF